MYILQVVFESDPGDSVEHELVAYLCVWSNAVGSPRAHLSTRSPRNREDYTS